MKIIKLILHRYNRFGLNGIETIEYDPQANTQIIIGSNGCGKSSLLDELSVIPPDKQDMHPGGYKVIVVEHRGERYTLRSDYKKTPKHSFIHHIAGGDQELNDGGTLTAQKILIERTFGLTIELMLIWLGRTKFTQLSPIKRRDWILKLSDNDIDFAMRVYNLAKSETRDRQGVEKHINKRLAEETAEIADQNRISALEDTVEQITTLLNQLLESKDNRLPSAAHVKLEIDRLSREFIECTTEALTTHLVKPRFLDGVNTLSELEVRMGSYRSDSELLQKQLKQLYQQKETIQSAVNALAQNGVGEVDDLAQITKDLRDEMQVLITHCPIYTAIDHASIPSMLEVYQSVIPQFLDALTALTDNTEGYYSTEKQNIAQTRLKRAQLQAVNIQDQIRQHEHAIQHYQTSDQATCPECKHQFKVGMGSFDVEVTKKQLVEWREKLAQAESHIERCETYLTAFNEYVQERNLVKSFMSNNPLLNPLWRLLVAEDLYKVVPTKHIPTIHHFGDQLKTCLTIHEIEQKINLNQTVLDRVQSATSGHQQLNDAYLDQIDQTIHDTLVSIENNHREMNETHRFQQEVENNYRVTRRAYEIRTELFAKVELLARADLNSQLGQVIQEHQLKLANATSALNAITRHDAVIKDIESQKVLASEDYRLHQIVTQTLSPVDGLISKYIQSFLDDFISTVNLVIDEIWSYDMEVLPCGVDSSDVTCKFPLSVNQGAKVSRDIAESSDGQTDVINFAFRMAVAEYLNLYDYPLYLDELAPTFDEQHRQNMIRYLNRLLEDGEYTQMFMVSHYASNHYAFANAEILMLDDRNIVKRPGVFNQHVKISYAGLEAAS